MAKRNIAAEIMMGIREIKEGKGKSFHLNSGDDIRAIRNNLNLSQASLSALMGISVRTLQEWEQGRRKPTGPACALLRIARDSPEAFLPPSYRP